MSRRRNTGRLLSTLKGERLALLLGFGLSIASTIGVQTYLQPAADHRLDVAARLDATWADLKLLRTAQAFQELATLFDGGVFMSRLDWEHDPHGSSDITDVMARAIHGRHEAVMNYFAQLASAHELDLTAASARYDALVAAERATWTLETYRATNAYPNDLARHTTTRIGELAQSIWHLEPDYFAAKADESRRSLMVAIAGAGGSTVLFLLALAATAAKPAAKSKPIDTGMAAAIELMTQALGEARRRLAAERAA